MLAFGFPRYPFRVVVIVLGIVVQGLYCRQNPVRISHTKTLDREHARVTPAPITQHPHDLRRRQQSIEYGDDATCGYIISDGVGEPMGCREGVCATSRSPFSQVFPPYVGCCGSRNDPEDCVFFTSCIEATEATASIEDPNVLTCSSTSACYTYIWDSGGASAFKCDDPFTPTGTATASGDTGTVITVYDSITFTSNISSSTSTGITTTTDDNPTTATQPSTPNTGKPQAAPAGHVGGLTYGAKIGIGVACGSVLFAVIGLVIFFCRASRRRRRRINAGSEVHQATSGTKTEVTEVQEYGYPGKVVQI